MLKDTCLLRFFVIYYARQEQAGRNTVPPAPTLQQADHANFARMGPFPIDIRTSLAGAAWPTSAKPVLRADHLVARAHLSQQALQGLPDNRCLVMGWNDDCRHVDSIQFVQHP